MSLEAVRPQGITCQLYKGFCQDSFFQELFAMGWHRKSKEHVLICDELQGFPLESRRCGWVADAEAEHR
jgi:hypothetical protein